MGKGKSLTQKCRCCEHIQFNKQTINSVIQNSVDFPFCPVMLSKPHFVQNEKSSIHPRNLTWNLKIMVSKSNFLFWGLLFRFHVKFRRCNSWSSTLIFYPHKWEAPTNNTTSTARPHHHHPWPSILQHPTCLDNSNSSGMLNASTPSWWWWSELYTLPWI